MAVDVRFGYVETPKNAVVYRQVFEDVADVTTGSVNISARPCWSLQMKGDKKGESARKGE